MRRVVSLVATSTVTILFACREPTQVTLSIDTDAACADVRGTAITTGRVAEIEDHAPVAETTACSAGDVGTLVLVPEASEDGSIFGLGVNGSRLFLGSYPQVDEVDPVTGKSIRKLPPLAGMTSGIADLDTDGSRVLVTQGQNVVHVFAPSP